jgi:hypothetical protein
MQAQLSRMARVMAPREGEAALEIRSSLTVGSYGDGRRGPAHRGWVVPQYLTFLRWNSMIELMCCLAPDAGPVAIRELLSGRSSPRPQQET